MNLLDHFKYIREHCDNVVTTGAVFSAEITLDKKNIDSLKKLAENELLESRVKVGKKSISVLNISLKDIGKVCSIELFPNQLSTSGFYYFENKNSFVKSFPLQKPEGKEFYIHDLNYHSQSTNNESKFINDYLSVIKCYSILRNAADYDNSNATLNPELIFISDKRLALKASYSSDSIEKCTVPDSFIEFFSEAKYIEHKRSILKNVLVSRFYERESQTFQDFLEDIDEIYFTVKKQFELFINEFSYDDFREKFINNILEFSDKTNQIVKNLEGKILVLPIGYILAFSQVKLSGIFSIVNVSIFLGMFVFWYLARLFVNNQIKAIELLDDEFTVFIDDLTEKVNFDHSIRTKYIQPVTERIKNQENTLNKISLVNHVIFWGSLILFIFYLWFLN